MATTEKNILNNWFKTGAKPSQEQFWNWQDSYWHKNEAIPQSQIQDLDKTLENKADTSALDAKANADASGLGNENVAKWKKALGVGELPSNIATVDEGGKQGNAYTKTEIDNQLRNKLNKPDIYDMTFTDDRAIEDGFMVIASDDLEDAFAVRTSDFLRLSGNMANSRLTTTTGGSITQGANYVWDTAGYYFSLKNLPNKSADPTFNLLLAQNGDGQTAVSNGKAVLENLMASLPSVKDARTGNYDMGFNEYLVFNPTTGTFKKSDRPQVVNNFPSQINVSVSDNVKNITIAPKPNYSQDVLDTLNFINRINEVNFTKFSTSQIIPLHIIDGDLPSSILSNPSQKSAIQNLVSVLKDGHIKYNGARGQNLSALYENHYVQDMIVKEKRAVVNVLFDKELPQNKEWCIRIESEMPYINGGDLTNCCIGFRNFKSNKCDAELSDVNFITNPHWDTYYRVIQPKNNFNNFIGVRSINFDLYIIKKGDMITYLVQGRETGEIAIYTEPYSERYKYMYFFKFLPPSDRYRAINNYEFYLKNISYWIQP